MIAVQDVRDRRADLDLGATISAAMPFIGSVAVASILASIGIGIGIILIIAPGLVLLTFWSLIVPEIVIGGACTVRHSPYLKTGNQAISPVTAHAIARG